ncbi:hypothetical protein ACB092_05G142700 [Castanea dentata]
MSMPSLRCLVFIISVLLVCATTETRPLKPTKEMIELSLFLQASNLVAKEAMGPDEARSTNETHNEQPDRLSPGGPDPHHHFMYPGQH